MKAQERVVSIHPYWKVSEGKLDDFQRVCQQFLSAVRNESKCVYFGFTFNDSEAFCREAYDGAEGVLEHLPNVASILAEALKIAHIARLEVHGAAEELAKLKTPLSQFNPTYFALLNGIRR